MKCYEQILDGTRLEHIEFDDMSTDAFVENDMWLQLHMLHAAAEYEAASHTSETDDTLNPDTLQATTGPHTSTEVKQSDGSRQARRTLGLAKTPVVSDDNPDDMVDELTSLLESKLSTHGVDASLLCALQTKRKQKPNPTIEPLRGDVKNGDIFSKEELLQYTDDGYREEDLINDPRNDPVVGDSHGQKNEHLLVEVHGSPELQQRIRNVVSKYKDVFSTTLPEQPARVTPLKFDVPENQWHMPGNQLPHRRQSIQKDIEILKQIRDMLLSEVVGESNAHAWSQVMMALKPNGKWRFCIDFRLLNQLILDSGWPIPRIQEVLERVGSTKPTVFGKMDLTSGYHQMPLAKECRKYTAFKTAYGLYEWLRVPMGLRNAAGHFQQRMATEVLNGLVNIECELYIDDVMIHATTENEFISRLEHVLQRLQARGLVVSPTKCSFGMSEMEILGHTITENGCHFSRVKLDKVNDTKLPETGGHLHSFIGLANYFRKHVRDYTVLDQKLRRVQEKFPGNRKIPWHTLPEEEEAFYALKQAVVECPRLFFYDDRMSVHLHTDACNGGIGAYLFQRDSAGEEFPIGFMSKALHGSELGWSTFEQECFAVHEALKQFEYLLRDVRFTIRTDHKNLLFLNLAASPKVQRWKWDIQQFNFNLEHIAGEDNIIADLWSRLCCLQSHIDDDTSMETITSAINVSRCERPAALLASLTSTTRMKTPRPWVRNTRPIDNTVYEYIQAVHGWGTYCTPCKDAVHALKPGIHGHGGVERTLTLLKDSLPPSKWWGSMRTDVRQFIEQCPQCQFMKVAKHHIHGATRPYNMSVDKPMERINIDTIGPLPADEHGNRYIMVIVDVFSRFMELEAIPDLSAETAAASIVRFIGRYGTPGEILTDNGTQYNNKLLKEIYETMIVDYITISPYSHEENSIVERVNKEVNRHLRAIVFDRKIKTKWAIALPLIQRVCNAMKHATTGYAPSQIIFANNIDLDRRVLHTPPTEDDSPVKYSDYVITLMNMQAEIIAKAQRMQEIVNNISVEKRLQNMSNRIEFAVNDYVLWAYPENILTQDSRVDKLSSHYRGPYRVIAIDGSRVQIQNLITLELKDVIVTQLVLFKYDPNIVDPHEVALHASQEFYPEKILKIYGKRNKSKRYLRTDLMIEIKWLGYSDKYNTWEPYSEIKLTSLWRKYCQTKGLQYLIPRTDD